MTVSNHFEIHKYLVLEYRLESFYCKLKPNKHDVNNSAIEPADSVTIVQNIYDMQLKTGKYNSMQISPIVELHDGCNGSLPKSVALYVKD